ncbi:hypothetical protein [Cellulomonas endophytica]|uniref:hypothetical protein n=1 Tax=Cellulomonas endophytica TaxID=2494735 RepID=UPI0010137C19|nr:hypothetical protein [Cellulomonas endophytica]
MGSRTVRACLVAGVVAAGLGTFVPAPARAGCPAPVLAVDGAAPPSGEVTDVAPVELARDGPVVVVGEPFMDRCADTSSTVTGPGCSGPEPPSRPDVGEPQPETDIPLVLEQGDRSWELGTADADADFTVSWQVRLPGEVTPGPATLRAGTAELPVVVAAG